VIIEGRSDLNMTDSVIPMPRPRKPTLKALADGKFSIVPLLTLQFPDQLFGCKLGF
jgi:hypothetical protein